MDYYHNITNKIDKSRFYLTIIYVYGMVAVIKKSVKIFWLRSLPCPRQKILKRKKQLSLKKS